MNRAFDGRYSGLQRADSVAGAIVYFAPALLEEVVRGLVNTPYGLLKGADTAANLAKSWDSNQSWDEKLTKGSQIYGAAGGALLAAAGVSGLGDIAAVGLKSAAEELGGAIAPAETTSTAELTQGVSDVTLKAEGEFSITDWSGYPDGPRPSGPFKILEGAEYEQSRDAANQANRGLHSAADPLLEGYQLHEIQPVKFGGSPTDPLNKIALTPGEHAAYTTWWNDLLRYMKESR